MIQSMTGYGAAQHAEDGVCYTLEIRSVNNRYLKVAIKLPDQLQFAEAEIDRLVRERVSRGTVSCTLRLRVDPSAVSRVVNMPALQQYVDLLSRVRMPSGVQATIDLATAALLPGVSDSQEWDEDARRREVDRLISLASAALDAMSAMRRDEGRNLREDLLRHCEAIRAQLATIGERAPKVIEEYHERLRTRVAVLMQSGGFELAADALAREVALFAERCDISEEVSRVSSHLDQFLELCDREDQVGRPLDFLTQELLREANTIASKSNDAVIARSVVQVKALIDRMKEQVQNVE